MPRQAALPVETTELSAEVAHSACANRVDVQRCPRIGNGTTPSDYARRPVDCRYPDWHTMGRKRKWTGRLTGMLAGVGTGH
jgi:hypothetical protein